MTIGRIVRAAAYLELSVRHVWLSLVGLSLAAHTVPDNMNELVGEVRAIVADMDLPEERRKWTESALIAAKSAYALRSRDVHDIWLPPAENDDDWRQQRFPRRGVIGTTSTSVPLSELHGHLAEIERASTRVGWLVFALHEYGQMPGAGAFASNAAHNWAIVRGDYEVGPGRRDSTADRVAASKSVRPVV